MNEEKILNDLIIPSLNENGWNKHDVFHYKVEHRFVQLEKTMIADVVLFALRNPIGIIEVKAKDSDLNLAILRAKSIADALELKLAIATDGFQFVKYNYEMSRIEAIKGIPSLQYMSNYFL